MTEAPRPEATEVRACETCGDVFTPAPEASERECPACEAWWTA